MEQTNIFTEVGSTKENFKLQIDSIPVWDYKFMRDTNRVYLISNTESPSPVEEVTLVEVKQDLIKNYMPLEDVKVYCEITGTPLYLKMVNIREKTIELSRYEG